MSDKLNKDLIKRNFTSGSRPTEKHFHDLIDKCFNEPRKAFVSGYGVLTDLNNVQAFNKLERKDGKTFLTPWFNRINTQSPHVLVYHYAIPLCNVESHHILDRLVFEVNLPKSVSYDLLDNEKSIRITQQVDIEYIKIHNGSEEIYTGSEFIFGEDSQELEVNKSVDEWTGIGLDIAVSYDIKSDKAVSDEFNVSNNDKGMLEHVFGAVRCLFD